MEEKKKKIIVKHVAPKVPSHIISKTPKPTCSIPIRTPFSNLKKSPSSSEIDSPFFTKLESKLEELKLISPSQERQKEVKNEFKQEEKNTLLELLHELEYEGEQYDFERHRRILSEYVKNDSVLDQYLSLLFQKIFSEKTKEARQFEVNEQESKENQNLSNMMTINKVEGSKVYAFTPVKIHSRKEIERLGSEWAISPVKRSIRTFQKQEKAINVRESVGDLLEQTGFSYVPNNNIL